MTRKLFTTLLALVCAVGTANATWWPSEHYCTFCNNFKIDHAFQFSSAGGQDNGSKYSYGVDFQECQGVIAFSLLTWDRRVLAEATNYGMKWVEVYLTGGSNDLWIADIYFTDPKSGGSAENTYKNESNFSEAKEKNGCRLRPDSHHHPYGMELDRLSAAADDAGQ